MDKSLKLKQNLMIIWEDHHLDFKHLRIDYEEVYGKMIEEKLRAGRNVFEHVMTLYPNLKFLLFENYGEARRFISNLKESDLIELIEVLDDFFESMPYKSLKSATCLYRDRLNRKKNIKCYAVVSGCYQKY